MLQRLRFGVIPDSEPGYALADQFANAVGAMAGMTVEVQRAIDYRVLLASIEQRRIDFAWVPPLGAARAIRAGTLTEIALTMRNGASSYMTGLITRKDSSLKSIADLKGVRAAW